MAAAIEADVALEKKLKETGHTNREAEDGAGRVPVIDLGSAVRCRIQEMLSFAAAARGRGGRVSRRRRTAARARAALVSAVPPGVFAAPRPDIRRATGAWRRVG